jgi:hypothetical protein
MSIAKDIAARKLLRFGGPVSKVVLISGLEENSPESIARRRSMNGLTTEHYRRLLSELRLRPPSQRAFLRKLLCRAQATGAPAHFPVVPHAVPDPVSPS